MGNEILNLRKDLIDLDIEEMKINRELYNLQLEINAKLPRDKKVRLKQNFKEIAGKKIKYLEEKKRLLIENENNSNNNNNNKQINKISTNENEILYNAIETGVAKNEEVKNREENKLNLVNNYNYNKKNKIQNNNKQKEIISSSESDNFVNVKTIYTRKNTNLHNSKIEVQKEEIKNNEKEKDLKKPNNVQEEEKKEDIKNNNDEDTKYNNYRYLNKKNDNDNDTNENINENLNINEYKRKFFDKLSSLCPRSNYNKSMDNKNSSIVEELEVVGLSQNDILKEKLSEFLVATSVATSNNKQNNSSLNNNYERPKSEISGINRQLISSNKSNTENGNDEGVDSINYQSNINIESQEFVGGENNKRFGTVATKEKYDTEETINNKETGNNTDEKYKEQNNENAVLNDKRLLRNNRNKSYFILEGSSSLDN